MEPDTDTSAQPTNHGGHPVSRELEILLAISERIQQQNAEMVYLKDIITAQQMHIVKLEKSASSLEAKVITLGSCGSSEKTPAKKNTRHPAWQYQVDTVMLTIKIKVHEDDREIATAIHGSLFPRKSATLSAPYHHIRSGRYRPEFCEFWVEVDCLEGYEILLKKQYSSLLPTQLGLSNSIAKKPQYWVMICHFYLPKDVQNKCYEYLDTWASESGFPIAEVQYRCQRLLWKFNTATAARGACLKTFYFHGNMAFATSCGRNPQPVQRTQPTPGVGPQSFIDLTSTSNAPVPTQVASRTDGESAAGPAPEIISAYNIMMPKGGRKATEEELPQGEDLRRESEPVQAARGRTPGSTSRTPQPGNSQPAQRKPLPNKMRILKILQAKPSADKRGKMTFCVRLESLEAEEAGQPQERWIDQTQVDKSNGWPTVNEWLVLNDQNKRLLNAYVRRKLEALEQEVALSGAAQTGDGEGRGTATVHESLPEESQTAQDVDLAPCTPSTRIFSQKRPARRSPSQSPPTRANARSKSPTKRHRIDQIPETSRSDVVESFNVSNEASQTEPQSSEQHQPTDSHDCSLRPESRAIGQQHEDMQRHVNISIIPPISSSNPISVAASPSAWSQYNGTLESSPRVNVDRPDPSSSATTVAQGSSQQSLDVRPQETETQEIQSGPSHRKGTRPPKWKPMYIPISGLTEAEKIKKGIVQSDSSPEEAGYGDIDE
ncbi:hypothetical protein N0V90_009056 [Kalmusia sp. IMI 367209]|nr:hypothetical protein N0V90_009056 [Kalmusia sp. IMI 367209]